MPVPRRSGYRVARCVQVEHSILHETYIDFLWHLVLFDLSGPFFIYRMNSSPHNNVEDFIGPSLSSKYDTQLTNQVNSELVKYSLICLADFNIS